MSARSETNVSLGQLRTLADLLRRGALPDDVRATFEELVSEASVTRVGPVLLDLIAERSGSQETRQLVGWFRDLSAPSEARPEAPCHLAGHPAETLRRENEALQLRVDRFRTAMQQMLGSTDAFEQARAALNELTLVDNHYRREEFLLFTRLERHGLVRPGRILWAAHDEVRQWLRYLGLQFALDDFGAGELSALSDSVVGPLLDDMEWMIRLEDSILLSMACETLDEADWEVVWEHSPKIGWCLVDPGSAYTPRARTDRNTLPAEFPVLPLPTGVLNLDSLAAIHGELPVDLTFVDSEDRVRFFTEGARPVFYRSQAILGRDVRCCHPPRSVHYVEQILSDFKSGRETSAQFWKHLGDRFIHIRFVALHDSKGGYLGALEIAQDITHLRALEGQQVELRYDLHERLVAD